MFLMNPDLFINAEIIFDVKLLAVLEFCELSRPSACLQCWQCCGGFLFFFFLSCPHHYFSASRLERQFEHTHADPEGHGDIYNFSMSKMECVFFCTSVPPIFDWNRIVCVFLSANGE